MYKNECSGEVDMSHLYQKQTYIDNWKHSSILKLVGRLCGVHTMPTIKNILLFNQVSHAQITQELQGMKTRI